jgi:signal transduction histidine kinase
MADELFFFSGLDLKAIPYEFQVLDVRAFLGDLWVELSLDFAGAGLWGPVPEFTETDLMIRADSAKLREVVVNLAENTVKFKRGTNVRWAWKASAQPDIVRLDFQDDGKGIAAEALPHIFNRFYRQDGSRTPSIPGTGLGLAIAKLIVEDHGGTIEVASVEGEGTTMSLLFPRLQAEDL